MHLLQRSNRRGCESWLCRLLAQRSWLSQPLGASFPPPVKEGGGQDGLPRAGVRADGGLQVECSLELGSVRRGHCYARKQHMELGDWCVVGGGGGQELGVGKMVPQESVSQLGTAEF